MQRGRLETDDGVVLSYEIHGDRGAPAIVFANGIGVDHPGATLQRAALQDYQFITWNYRGVGESVVPHAEIDVSMPRHARDLLTILDHLKISRTLLVGWSMGVQVGLEVARLAPERLSGFVALLGAFGRPFRYAFPAPLATAIEKIFSLGANHPTIAQLPLELAVALPRIAFHVLSAAVFVGADADRSIFASNVSSVRQMNRRVYLRTMLELATHDAEDMLSKLPCPALIIAGSRDHITPPAVARRMAETIPDAEYREVTDGTHFALIEKPELINGWIRDLAARVYADPPPDNPNNHDVQGVDHEESA